MGYTLCPQKVVHQSHGNNFVNSQRIFKILSLLERELNCQQNPCNTCHHTFSCRTTSRNLAVRICGNFQKNNLKIVSYLTKTETYLVIWLTIVTIVARSVRLLPAHMHEDGHAIQLHCQWWSGQCHAKYAENAASVHNTCLDKIEYLTKNI